MFREMRRFKQQMTEEECKEILRHEPRGVLSLIIEEGYPYGVPMDFYYDEEKSKLYFHGAAEGQKIDSIKRNEKASFTILDQGVKNPDEWFYHFQSVILFGKMELVTDHDEKYTALQKLGEKYMPTLEHIEKEITRDGERSQVLSLSIEHMTGKKVREK